jgi:hypothetical protein
MSEDSDDDFKFNKSSDEENGSDKGSDSGKGNNFEDNPDLGKDPDKEEDGGKTKRNEVRKEFSFEFEKKIAKYIPPKIKFKGNIVNRKIIKELNFGEIFISNLTLFKTYILLTVDSTLHFYDKTLKLIFEHKFVEPGKEVLSLNNYNDETLIMGADDKVLVINIYDKNSQITYEVIQEFKDTEFYCLNEKLYNGFLLIGGMDRKYGFYEVIHKKEKISKDNKFQLKFKIHKVHNVYDDDCPGIVDLNNGRLFSWLNDDKNIKVIEYSSRKPRIIKSKNGYGLHNAGLLCDKYLLLMGLTYPKYYSWLMDTETLNIVYAWNTPQNDSFMCTLSENKFLYGSETRFACDEFSAKDGKFSRKNLYNSKFRENITDRDWEESYGIREFLDENTFITYNMAGRLMIFKCDN